MIRKANNSKMIWISTVQIFYPYYGVSIYGLPDLHISNLVRHFWEAKKKNCPYSGRSFIAPESKRIVAMLVLDQQNFEILTDMNVISLILTRLLSISAKFWADFQILMKSIVTPILHQPNLI